MIGIGLMLPGIPIAESMEHLSKKVRKHTKKLHSIAGSVELAPMQRHLTANTEGTQVEKRDIYAFQAPQGSAHHQRDLSSTVNWAWSEFERIATQLYDGTIADIELSLFAYWIIEKEENYRIAKGLVRELALDQVSCSSKAL